MCCKWNVIGLTAAAFGIGVLFASLFPPALLVPCSAVILVVASITLIL
ncbi:MAG: hypothetical protein Q4F79_01130 [Eubacteriales bacterium]|nr:hypothetical protein [Eubacteriales bacterium]